MQTKASAKTLGNGLSETTINTKVNKSKNVKINNQVQLCMFVIHYI